MNGRGHLSAGRRYRALLALAVAVLLAASVTLVSIPSDGARGTVAGPRGASAVPSRTSSATPRPEAGVVAESGKRAAVARLLHRRARAIRDDDLAAFLSTVDGKADAAFRKAQRRLFDNLQDVPLNHWSYRLGRADAVSQSRLAGLRGTAQAVWAPRVTVSYGFSGVDSAPTGEQLGFLFAERGGQWYLESDSALSRFGVTTWRGPWHFAPCRVRRTEQGMVLSHPGDGDIARDVAAELDSAVAAVTAVWGDRWSRDVAVIVPASGTEMRAMAGPEFSVDSIAAVAVASTVDHTRHVVRGQRVILNPEAAGKLSQESLRVILRHEITHIATRAYTVDGSPMWVLEGFADFVGHRGSSTPFPQAAPDLATLVRTSGPPSDLPANDEFDAGSPRIDLAYQEAWSMNMYVAQRFGQSDLVALYRALAGASQVDARQVAATITHVTGKPYQEVIAGWRDFLRERLR